jgi:hypothetical protein
MGKGNKEIRLGELITALGLVKESQLATTLRRAMQVGLPIGRALVMSGYVTEDELSTALEIQSLLRADEVSLEEASQAFNLVSVEGVSLIVALKRIGIAKTSEVRSPDGKLGTLLIDANLIKFQQLEEAQKRSQKSGTPLGRTLGLMGLLLPTVLDKAMELQNMIREGMITYGDALKILRTTGERKPTVAIPNGQKDAERKEKAKPIRLVDLLTRAKVVSEEQMANAIEVSFTRRDTLGDILKDLGHLSDDALNLAFELQRSVAEGNIDAKAAAETLQYVGTGKSVERAAKKAEAPPQPPQDVIRVGELLRVCGFVDGRDIEESLNLSHKCSSLIGEMLVLTGVIGEATLIATLRCQSLLRRGIITLDIGVKALQLSAEQHMSFDEALESLGVSLSVNV